MKMEELNALFDTWSNAACCGYLIKVCEAQGFGKEQIYLLLKSMNHAFEGMTVDEAKTIFYDF